VTRAALALLLVSCTGGGLKGSRPCESDAQCGAAEICFSDGCGDPGRDLVVEVTPNARAGQLEQDFALASGLTAQLDFEVRGPSSLGGVLQRNVGAVDDLKEQVLYTDEVLIRAEGESTIIPGRVRSYEQTFVRPERGAWELRVGEGTFTVTATPAEPSVPVAEQREVRVAAGGATSVRFAFPSVESAVVLAGRLLRQVKAGPPPVELAVTQTSMEVQVFDSGQRRALSQRVAVSSGSSGSKGDFVLSMDPAARLEDRVTVIATAKDPSALVPSKIFRDVRPLQEIVSLQLGEYGEALPQVGGQILSSAGQPVAGALVFLSGTVGGGGVFSSRKVFTDKQGQFAVDLLPSPDGSDYTVTVLPPAGVAGGALVTKARASAQAGTSAILEPASLSCPDKLPVTGIVELPGGGGAPGVEVLATAIQPVDGLPLTLESSSALTDARGGFALEVDPGVYRLDFVPTGDLPRASRVIEVHRSEGGVALNAFALSFARRVRGTVRYADQSAVPRAGLKLFRVTAGPNGVRSSQLIAEGLADEQGAYTLVVPTDRRGSL
jgi:hypothetical protein